MLPEQPEQHAADGLSAANEEATSSIAPLYLLPFEVQLQNIFSTEIIAKRFPVDILNAPEARFNISEIQIDGEHLRAQVILDVHIEFSGEARPFEISFKMVGLFIYPQEYNTETLHSFLAQGSLSILLPFARELLLNLCNRLQIPPLMLTLTQLAPPPMAATKKENAPH